MSTRPFRTKRFVVRAVQWMGHAKGPHDLGIVPLSPESEIGVFETSEGKSAGTPGDWVVFQPNGAKCFFEEHVFKQRYEPIP